MTEWNSELELGYPKIDNHHRIFLKTINKFLQKLNQGVDLKVDLETLLYFLTDYVETHFIEEEQILKKINYFNYSKHKQAHQRLKENLGKLKRKYWELVQDSSDLFLIKLFITNLKEDLINKLVAHMKEEDSDIIIKVEEAL
ncbi:bacteriohemerythrin [Orenia metallireducens]|uniref:bacteriohemerythrin n=1 Tax=Orenia metallireducens TaxID=1413210 RepID=UPI0009F6214C|nr:hemerythrin domain-containing protein [Orenia metallireducens]